MYRRSDWIELGLLALACVLIYAGVRLSWPILTDLGGFSIGAFALVAGFEAIRTKRLGFETRQRNFGPRELYTGLAAQLWGVLFIAFAILVFILVGVAWLYPGGAGAFWAAFLGRPWGWGIVLLGIGLTLVINGVIRFLAGSAGYYKGLADLVERTSGVIPLFLGSGLALVGLLLILAPGPLTSLARLAANTIQHWFFH
jgi:hypothetical protein